MILVNALTPFDEFMHAFSAWLDTAWYLWVAIACALALVVAVVAVSKARARDRARVPQYRRHAGG